MVEDCPFLRPGKSTIRLPLPAPTIAPGGPGSNMSSASLLSGIGLPSCGVGQPGALTFVTACASAAGRSPRPSTAHGAQRARGDAAKTMSSVSGGRRFPRRSPLRIGRRLFGRRRGRRTSALIAAQSLPAPAAAPCPVRIDGPGPALDRDHRAPPRFRQPGLNRAPPEPVPAAAPGRVWHPGPPMDDLGASAPSGSGPTLDAPGVTPRREATVHPCGPVRPVSKDREMRPAPGP